MDDTDRRLLTLLQHEIPLRSRPFAILGEKIGIDGAEVLLRINRLKTNRLIRKIAGVFDTRKFGYKLQTAALRMNKEALESAAQAIAEFPAVLFCTARDHEWNLWITAAVPSWESSESAIRKAAQQAGVTDFRIFTDLQVVKRGGRILEPVAEPAPAFNSLEMQVIAALQDDLPLTDEPFAKIAHDLWINEAKLLEILSQLRERKIFHRISVSFFRKVHECNEALVIWQVPEEKQIEVALQLAYFDEVVFCARRTCDAVFPYNIHTLLQTPRSVSIEQAVRNLENQVGRGPRLELKTVQEYKKSRFKYFSEIGAPS